MADRSLVSSSLSVTGFDDAELAHLLELLSAPHRAARWVAWSGTDGGRAVWPPDGSSQEITDAGAFCEAQGGPGVAFTAHAYEAFLGRFPQVSDPLLVARVAGFVAPVLTDLHSEVRGINYDLRPGDRTQKVLNLFGRFLPKNKAIALRMRPDSGAPVCMYVRFNGRRQVETIVGRLEWPEALRTSGPLKELKFLGAPVEIGINASPEAVYGLFEGRLNRQGYAALFKSGELEIEPCPLTVKLALKAAGLT